MTSPGAVPTSPVSSSDESSVLALLDRVLADFHQEEFEVRLWNGTVWRRGGAPKFTLVLQHPGALRAMIQDANELKLGEAYIYDDFDIEGDIFRAVRLGQYLLNGEFRASELLEFATLLRKLPRGDAGRAARAGPALAGSVHSRQRDRKAIQYHYDVPVEFYRLWLDSRMVYSCAYFRSPQDDLDTAQYNKLERICKKLRLIPGDRLLDIGCGWGGLIIHAAQRYGAQALGITLSPSQAEFANTKIREAGLEDRCRVEVCDYRDVNGRGSY